MLIFSFAVFSQEDGEIPPENAATVYVARDNGEGEAGDPVTEFLTTDIPIFCVVRLEQPEQVTVKMQFIAVNVKGVKPNTKVITTSYTLKEGEDRVFFKGRPDKNWVAGHYRANIYVDGMMAASVEFDIKPPPGISQPSSGKVQPTKRFDRAKRSARKH